MSYLSSARLLGLQMADPALRRTFLTQCLILLHACQHPHKSTKDQLRGKQVQLLPLSHLHTAKLALPAVR